MQANASEWLYKKIISFKSTDNVDLRFTGCHINKLVNHSVPTEHSKDTISSVSLSARALAALILLSFIESQTALFYKILDFF
jgi:hypothetical protein